MGKLRGNATMAAIDVTTKDMKKYGLKVTEESLNDVAPPDNIEQEAMNAFGMKTNPSMLSSFADTDTWGNGIPRGKILDKKTAKLRDMTNKEKSKRFLKESSKKGQIEEEIFRHSGVSTTVSGVKNQSFVTGSGGFNGSGLAAAAGSGGGGGLITGNRGIKITKPIFNRYKP